MELRHLHYFVTVADEMSITRAALKLRIAQPSLTRQIRSLEEQLDAPLFYRDNNKLSLTEAGRFSWSARAGCSRSRHATCTTCVA